jgi:hypothetical protein
MSLRIYPILVCGDRNWDDYEFVAERLDRFVASLDKDYLPLLISGGATGADTAGEAWAIERKVSRLILEAPWNKLGKRAGPWRNGKMHTVIVPRYGFAFHDYIVGSKGTKDMIKKLERQDIPHELCSHKRRKRG